MLSVEICIRKNGSDVVFLVQLYMTFFLGFYKNIFATKLDCVSHSRFS